MENIFNTVTAFLAGILTGLGAGGGNLLAVALGGRLEQKALQGLCLLFAVPVGCVVVFIGRKNYKIKALPVAAAAVFGILGSAAGIFLIKIIPVKIITFLNSLVITLAGAAELKKSVKERHRCE